MLRRRLTRRRIVQGLSVLPALVLLACGKSRASSPTATPQSPDAIPEPTATPTPAPGVIGPPTAAAVTSPTTQPSPAATAASTALYFPPPAGEWQTATPEEAGFTQQGVQDLVTFVAENRSVTFMLLYRGRIVTEDYFSGWDATRSLDVASVQKSVTSTLIGIAREKGLLSLDDKVSQYLGEGWSRAAPAHEAAITVYDLMTQSSGLDPVTLKSAAAPGTKFVYNTAAYQRLRPVLEKVSGMDINALSRRWLFDAIGIDAATQWGPREDKDAMGVVQWGLSMSARDMARYGLMAFARGQWAGTSMVKSTWFDEAWTSCKTQSDYGLLWWLMGRGLVKGPAVPSDWVGALGARDQKIYVFPSQGIVLIRQGLAAKEDSEAASSFDTLLFRELVAARA